MKTLVICSGGLDSVTLAYHVQQTSTLSGLLTFDYGQRHKTEIAYAQDCAKALNVPISVIDISSIGDHLSGSALTDDIDVPEGHYTQDNMSVTVVPNRNAIMLSIGYGIAAARGLDRVAAAFHGGDHYIYPDCRPAFVKSFDKMQKKALDGVADVALYTPFLNKTKTDIARIGVSLHVPFEQTWSCYKGGDVHCGRCSTCIERQSALHEAGAHDQTIYKDPEYWKTAGQI